MKSTNRPAIISLKNREPFASGGNRLCFLHPEYTDRCLKVIREDRTPEIRRSEKRFPANLRPLSIFDENRVEVSVLNYLHTNYPVQITRHLPRSFGLVETDLGMAHETTLICDSDSLVSQTLEQYVWENGLNSLAEKVIRAFKDDWAVRPPRTRDLIPHNFVVQLEGNSAKLVMIDGFGKTPFIKLPFQNRLMKLHLRRRLKNFDYRVQLIKKRKAANDGPISRINNLRRQI